MTAKPMTPAAFRRLLASAEGKEADQCQRLYEAEARGRWVGLLLIQSIHRNKR